MKIQMRYGEGALVFDVPDDRVGAVIRPRTGPETSSPVDLEALPASSGAADLRAASLDRRVLLLLPDETRGEPTRRLITTLLACLDRPASIDVVVATGSHRSDTEGNRAIISTIVAERQRAGAPPGRTTIHDCRTARFTRHGTTSRGTPVLLSDMLDEAEVLVAAGDVKHHYFAGYSNPTKCIVPGIAAFEMIEANHRFAIEPDAVFGRHPLHPDAARHVNPVAEDMIEAFEIARAGRPAFALATVTRGGVMAHAEIGPLDAVIGRAMVAVDRVGSFRRPRSRRVVVSAGGTPMDSTLYLSQRALELTRAAIDDGARVLLLAKCDDGIADTPAAYRNFYEELTRPLDDVMKRIQAGYRLYQHKAYRFAEMIRRVDRLCLASSLPEADVRRIHLEPVADPIALVAQWAREDPAEPITFFDEANRLCVLGETDS